MKDENNLKDELMELIKLDIFDEKYIIASCSWFEFDFTQTALQLYEVKKDEKFRFITTLRMSNDVRYTSRCFDPTNETYVRFQNSLVFLRYITNRDVSFYLTVFDFSTEKEKEIRR